MDPANPHSDPDPEDGLRGPVGPRFAAALASAAAHEGFVATYPTLLDRWVNQPWQGRRLVIQFGPKRAQAVRTGCRWIAVQLSTSRLGAWANPPKLGGSGFQGRPVPLAPPPGSPTGFYADDPRLLDALWSFTARLVPPGTPLDQVGWWLDLGARNDSVAWHFRAQRLDGALLSEAIDLLSWFANHSERFDQSLTTRIGELPSIASNRRLEKTVLFLAVGFVVAILLFMVVGTILTALFGG